MRLIGLMSGTSADGVDAALVDIEADKIDLLARYHQPYDRPLREELLALMAATATDLEYVAELDVRLGELFAAAASALLQQAGVDGDSIDAIGCHGQTVRHRPVGRHPFSLQLGKGAVIAARTGITTINDFRAADIAAGGHGAPLVPAFHEAVFRSEGVDRVVVNIGGMANITVLPGDPAGAVTGFDTGPGNGLLDLWASRHLGQPHDEGGAWGAGGSCCAPLLNALRSDDYFSQVPPKSAGREQFNLHWLENAMLATGTTPSAQDVQATLLALTADTISDAIRNHANGPREVFVCGGGIHNKALMTSLQQGLGAIPVQSTAALGIDPDWVEATAFAWLAQRTLAGRAGNLPAVTGARYRAILGAMHPAPVAR